jgi:hypothetical protein
MTSPNDPPARVGRPPSLPEGRASVHGIERLSTAISPLSSAVAARRRSRVLSASLATLLNHRVSGGAQPLLAQRTNRRRVLLCSALFCSASKATTSEPSG